MIDQSIRISRMELPGRIVMPPMATYLGTEDGGVTDALIAYYEARAKNRYVGLIFTEHSYVSMQGKAKPKQLSIGPDADMEGLRRLTDAIHRHGTKAIAQLNHAGSMTRPSVTGMGLVSASGMVHPLLSGDPEGTVPEELTPAQIGDIAKVFADAAARAKIAGYDGVEIHSAHAYFLNQFYSPLMNRRKDKYGGCLENRIRIHKEVIAAVRQAVGEGYPISLRLGGCDYMEGGSTIEDSVLAAAAFEKAGIDMISLSGGLCRYTLPGRSEPGFFRDMSSAVKAAVSIPVMLTGGVKTPEDAEMLLAEGAADIIGVGRALLNDPDWPSLRQKGC